MKKVFIVDLQRPWRPIREVECEIVSGKKFVWADDDHRHLLGASAFFVRKGAERRKLHALNQCAVTPQFVDRGFRSAVARTALHDYKLTGIIS